MARAALTRTCVQSSPDAANTHAALSTFDGAGSTRALSQPWLEANCQLPIKAIGSSHGNSRLALARANLMGTRALIVSDNTAAGSSAGELMAGSAHVLPVPGAAVNAAASSVDLTGDGIKHIDPSRDQLEREEAVGNLLLLGQDRAGDRAGAVACAGFRQLGYR